MCFKDIHPDEQDEYGATVVALAEALQLIRVIRASCSYDGWSFTRLFIKANQYRKRKYGR